jgi:hypothetical protein
MSYVLNISGCIELIICDERRWGSKYKIIIIYFSQIEPFHHVKLIFNLLRLRRQAGVENWTFTLDHFFYVL